MKTVKTVKTLKCSMCKKSVKDKTIIKHLWADHRAHMMKNHKGGFFKGKKKDVVPTETTKQHQKLIEALKSPFGTAFKRHATLGFLSGVAAEQHLRASYVANGKRLTVKVYQGQNQIELSNVTFVEILE